MKRVNSGMVNWRPLALLCGLLLPLQAYCQTPTFPKGFSGIAQFETTGGFQKHGWASLVSARQGSEPCILSVRRLLGPEGGFARQASVAEAPAFVRQIKIDSSAEDSQGYIVGGLPIPSAETNVTQSPIGDLSVYRIHNDLPQNRNVVLAQTAPAVGETVWLLTKVGDSQALRSAAVVASRRETWLSVRLSAEPVPKEMIGAPVLNAAGELVGVFSHRDPKNPFTLNLIPAAVIAKVLPQT